MPRVKWAIDSAEPDDLEGWDTYDGPEIKNGVYDGVVTRLTIKTNSNGDDMLNGMWVCRDNRPDKKQFNGYVIWFNQNVTEQGSKYVKAMLKAMGITWDDFVKRCITESDDRPTKVTKIGRVKFNDGAEVPMRVQVGTKPAQGDYPAKPDIKQYLLPREDDQNWDADDSGDDGDDEDDPFA